MLLSMGFQALFDRGIFYCLKCLNHGGNAECGVNVPTYIGTPPKCPLGHFEVQQALELCP